MRALLEMRDLFFRKEQWNIGFIDQPIDVFVNTDPKPNVRWLRPLKLGKYLADPFGLVKDGRVHVLCEEYDRRTSHGRIVSIELKDQASPSEPKIVLDLPVHASHPYLVEHRGEIYCVPETWQAREIGLYKAEEFPLKWRKLAPLITDFEGIDATLFQYQGTWWLTCTDREEGASRRLFVWYASDLMGPWKAHAANPVKVDNRSSRPAGTPFFHNGYLYRPAQDCSKSYGARIVINRVLRLTPTQFEEEQAAVIEPDASGPYPDGVHTVSGVGDITLVDGRRFMELHEVVRIQIMRLRSRRLRRSRSMSKTFF